jgi:DNA-directed RNA polymerase specialized sigma24 family protein
VFNLFIIDGFTHEEIAGMLQIKVSLSRKRLARARAWLQEKPKSLNAILGDYRFSIS